MALPLSSPLSEIRARLAVRLELGRQAETNESVRDLLGEYIRSAFHLLIRDADWAILQVRRTVDLVNAQHAYDVPDDIDVGNIELITVQNTNNREYPLHPGVNSYERSAFRIDRGGEADTNQASLPLRWLVENGELRLYPAPDTETYPTMVIYGKALPREPRENADRANVDDEALLLGAEVIGKGAMNKPGVRDVEMRYARHLRNIRAAQSDGEVVQLGPARSARFTYPGGREGYSDRDRFWPDFDPFSPFVR